MVYTEKRMDEVKNGLISSLEDLIQYEISYKSISPSIFSFININDLVIYGDGGKDDVLIEIKSFKAFYSPFYFFSRDNLLTPLQAVKRFNINKAQLVYDEEKDQALLELLFGQGENNRISLLPLTTRINGRNIDVRLKTALGELVAEDLFVSLIPEEGIYKTRVNGELHVRFSDETSPVKWASASFNARGSVTEFFESINFTVGTEDFSSDIADLTDQTFQFISTAEGLELRKVQDNAPIDLALRYDNVLDDLIFTFNAEKFRPDSILTLKGDFSEYQIYIASEITGDGSIMFNQEGEAAVYSLSADINLNRNVFDRYVFLRTDLTGDLSRINVRSLDLRTVEGRALFSGEMNTENFYPKGRLRLVNVVTPNGFTINSRINVDNDSGFLHFQSDSLDLGARELEDLNLVIFPDKETITASLEATLPAEEKRGSIRVDSIVSLTQKPAIDSFITLDSLPAESLYPLLPIEGNLPELPRELLDTSLSSNLYVETDLEDFTFMVSRFELASNTVPDNKLTFSASLDREGFKFNDLYLNWDDYDLNGYINSSIDEGVYRVSTHFDFEDKPYHVQAHYSDNQLMLEGDYGLYGFFQKTGRSSYSYKLSSNGLPIPLEGYTFLADLDASGRIEGTDWSLFLDGTTIRTGKFLTLASPEIEITADFDREGADLYELSYRDEKSSLRGLGRISYFPGEINSWLSLLDETGKTDEQYDLFFSMINGEIESRLSVVSTPLERFQETGLSGNLSLDVLFNGTLDDPEYQAVIETEQMNLNGVPVVVSSFVRGDKERVRISDMELEYSGIMLNRGLVMIELDEGKLLATGAINQVVNRSRASTSITAVLDSDETLDIFSLDKLREGGMTGKLTIAPITWDGLKTFPRLDVDLKKDGALLSGNIGSGSILSSSYNLDNGDLILKINDLFPVRLDARGRLFESEVDVAISDLRFDPSFLNYFMPTEPFDDNRAVIFTSGDITGDFRVSGPVTDPDYNGNLQVNDLLVESPFLAEIPEPVNTTASLEGHNLILEPFSIVLNKGRIDIESSFEFDEALPTTYNVDVEIAGTSGARIAYAIPGFSWDGHFTGYTHIEGSRDGGFLKGDLICNDLVSSLESDAEFNPVRNVPKNPSVNGFTVDLTVQTGRDVNFYLPNRQVPIIQATADNGDNINIAYDSRSDELALVGRVDIRTGEINYFNKTFYLQEGFIDFDESQVKFNPRLNVRADVISKDELGDDVTISLLFDDYLMNEFEPEFLSFPRKTENEILALLGQSFIPSNDPEQVSVASLIVATGGMIGKSTIMQPFEEAIKSSLDLDFVSFNTNIIENAILDRFQDQDLYSQGNQEMNFARYLEDTSLFVGEYIGDFLFLEGSLVVDYDESHSVSSTFGGLELNLNLNLQFITPFVLIDWTYDPMNNPGSDYFFPQNTISFTWQYSY